MNKLTVKKLHETPISELATGCYILPRPQAIGVTAYCMQSLRFPRFQGLDIHGRIQISNQQDRFCERECHQENPQASGLVESESLPAVYLVGKATAQNHTLTTRCLLGLLRFSATSILPEPSPPRYCLTPPTYVVVPFLLTHKAIYTRLPSRKSDLLSLKRPP